MKRLLPKIQIMLASGFSKNTLAYVAKGSAWWLGGKLSLLVAALATMLAFAHWVPKETFGTYQYVISAFQLVSIFALPGMGPALVRAIAKNKDGTLSRVTSTKIRWALTGSTLLILASVWYLVNQNIVLSLSFLIGALLLPLNQAYPIFAAFWNGKKKFNIQAKYVSLSAALATVVLLATLYLTNNVIIILISFFASQTLFNWIFYKKTLDKIDNQDLDLEAISYGKHLTLMEAVEITSLYVDKIVAWHMLGPISLAIYSFAQLPIQKLSELMPIVPLALPKLSEDKQYTKASIYRAFNRLLLISIVFVIFLILLAPWLYQILFPQYMNSVPLFRILSLVILAAPFTLFFTSLLADMKKKELYTIRIISPSIKIALFIILTPILGIWGIVAAILVSETIKSLLSLYLFSRS